MANREEILAHLPLTPALFHVLIALSEGPRHGYLILKEVEEKTEGRVRLSSGTLYGIVKRLLNDGWIRETRLPRGQQVDQRRRYYELTDLGKEVARAEAIRLRETLSLAKNSPLFGEG